MFFLNSFFVLLFKSVKYMSLNKTIKFSITIDFTINVTVPDEPVVEPLAETVVKPFPDEPTHISAPVPLPEPIHIPSPVPLPEPINLSVVDYPEDIIVDIIEPKYIFKSAEWFVRASRDRKNIKNPRYSKNRKTDLEYDVIKFPDDITQWRIHINNNRHICQYYRTINSYIKKWHSFTIGLSDVDYNEACSNKKEISTQISRGSAILGLKTVDNKIKILDRYKSLSKLHTLVNRDNLFFFYLPPRRTGDFVDFYVYDTETDQDSITKKNCYYRDTETFVFRRFKLSDSKGDERFHNCRENLKPIGPFGPERVDIGFDFLNDKTIIKSGEMLIPALATHHNLTCYFKTRFDKLNYGVCRHWMESVIAPTLSRQNLMFLSSWLSHSLCNGTTYYRDE